MHGKAFDIASGLLGLRAFGDAAPSRWNVVDVRWRHRPDALCDLTFLK